MTEERETNILLVEDTEEHAVLMRRALEKGKLKPRLFWITDGKAALDFLHNQGVYANGEALEETQNVGEPQPNKSYVMFLGHF